MFRFMKFRYEVTFVNTENMTKITCQIVSPKPKAFGKSQGYQIPALATPLYVDWLPQVNGPPPALPPDFVDHKCAIRNLS